MTSAVYIIMIGANDYIEAAKTAFSSMKSSSSLPKEPEGANARASDEAAEPTGVTPPLLPGESVAVRLRELEERMRRSLGMAGATTRAEIPQSHSTKEVNLQQMMRQLPKELQRVVTYAVGNITEAAEVR